MLKTLQNAFKVKEIRSKLLYTFLMLIVIRIGSQLPTPGINGEVFTNWFSGMGDSFNFFDAITGGSFENMSIFALSITPYITASIIVQLLTIAIPKLEEMQKDGEEGRKKMTAITRYLTVGLSLLESTAMAIGFERQNALIGENTVLEVLMVIVALTAGSTLQMWIGERITVNGIGNGISIVLLINIVSRLPQDAMSLYDMFIGGKSTAKAVLAAIIIIALIIALVLYVVLLQDAERKIPVNYSKKMQGRRAVGGQSSSIPLKVNTANVIPIIFAQSLLQFPVVIGSFFGANNGTGIGAQILKGLSSSNWCDPHNLQYTWGLLLYIVLIIAFAYFYTSITFNPLEIANNLKRQGGFIPGVRPGKPTSDYLVKVLNRIIFIGAVGLTIAGIYPIFFNGVFGANVSFGGTSIIIIAGVVVETLKQIETMMLVRNYKGFLSR